MCRQAVLEEVQYVKFWYIDMRYLIVLSYFSEKHILCLIKSKEHCKTDITRFTFFHYVQVTVCLMRYT